MKQQITVRISVNAPIEKVWECWTAPKHITKWCQASSDWHAPRATNNLAPGGKFLTRMEAKDGSAGFDFEGIYKEITKYKSIGYEILDGRNVKITFTESSDGCLITETFEAEDINTLEKQKEGWQAILNNFKKYAEESYR